MSLSSVPLLNMLRQLLKITYTLRYTAKEKPSYSQQYRRLNKQLVYAKNTFKEEHRVYFISRFLFGRLIITHEAWEEKSKKI